MTDLMWPGDQRAGLHMTDASLWQAMLRVESAWLHALAETGLVPASAADCDLSALVTDDDQETVAACADTGGNPVIGLVDLLRRRAPRPIRSCIHCGLTSQDVLDSALMLVLRDALAQLGGELSRQITALSELATRHHLTPMVGRTLTQHAVPTSFGVKVAGWLHGLCHAAERTSRLVVPVQIGGAAGTLAATTELATLLQGAGDAAEIAMCLAALTAHALGLAYRPPWHTSRGTVTDIGDALVSCTDAWGRIASDVVTLARPEIGELAEPSAPGRGGSSTMPDKHNPVLSVLIRRAAMTGPPLAATLHTAAVLSNDERPDGAWHAEWDTLRILARRTLVAASHATELLDGLQVGTDRMAANLDGAAVLGEQHSIAALTHQAPSPTYFGAAEQLITAALDRAHRALKDLA